MKKRILMLFIIVIGLLVVACAPKEVIPPDANDDEIDIEVETEPEDIEQEPTEETVQLIPMSDFFPSDNVNSHFKGEGNEFAELEVEIIHLDDQYVIQREDNSGSYIQTIYKINDENIEIIEVKPIDFGEALPTVDQLQEVVPISIYLQQPFEEGATFGDWKIIDIGTVIETPYQTFNNAIIIEMNEDDFIERRYFVQTIGEVKRESIMMTEGEDDYVVTSTLESITE